MRPSLLLITALFVVAPLAPTARGQQPPVHYFHSGNLPPGTVGQGQVQRFWQLRGYFQPVSILVPEGARVSLNVQGHFDQPREGPVLAGMQVGHVYQLKVTGIPFQPGREVFPTIEVINRTYPPAGKEFEFPVPVQLTQEELELALDGRFVTRVIYLEDPRTALAVRDQPDQQRYFDAPRGQDPLRVADRLGRPVAILRMGSRVPETDQLGSMHAGPPIQIYPSPPPQEERPDVSEAIERETQNYPRTSDRPPPVRVPPAEPRFRPR